MGGVITQLACKPQACFLLWLFEKCMGVCLEKRWCGDIEVSEGA